jgi:N utilization substance protein B
MRRSDQRREAAFAIYQHDVTGRDLDELLGEAKPFTRALAEGTAGEIESLDAEIGAHARGWSIDRIAPLEKAIMRVALFEIHHRDDVPTPVAIDEAVSIAGRYCGADAPGFVNGVLSAASRDTASSGPADPAPEPAGGPAPAAASTPDADDGEAA